MSRVGRILGVPYTVEKAYELVESAHGRGRLAHAFLVTGPAGSGKEALAARMIGLVNPVEDVGGANLFGEVEVVEDKSLSELEGELVRVVRPESKSRKIDKDSVRAVEGAFHMSSAPGKWKVGVIIDADRMGVEAENAFLKTLEEPPPGCLLILLTAAPELLLPTILSRCVRMDLMPSEGSREPGDRERKLLEHLRAQMRGGFGGVGIGLTIRAGFSALLAESKAELVKANEAELKEEIKKYKNTTDSGDWLKRRETYYTARAEAEYLSERTRLLDVLVSWMGDALRAKSGVEQLDFPTEAKVTGQVAAGENTADLLRRVEALSELRQNLETNVQEQLALEVAFLRAFG